MIKKKIKKIDIIFIVILTIFTIMAIALFFVPEYQALITNIWDIDAVDTAVYEDFMEEMFSRMAIVFVVCIVGNLLPVPTPYSWAVCLGASYIVVNPFLPLLFGIIAAFGCLVGEMVGYLIGRGAAEIISEERARNLDKYQQYLVEHPKLAPFLIFLFGLTPLNDDMLTVPLGLIKYSAKKTILWMWLGKLGMMLLFAYNVINICGLIGGENWFISIATIFAIVIMIWAMIRVDFSKIFKKKGNSASEI